MKLHNIKVDLFSFFSTRLQERVLLYHKIMAKISRQTTRKGFNIFWKSVFNLFDYKKYGITYAL